MTPLSQTPREFLMTPGSQTLCFVTDSNCFLSDNQTKNGRQKIALLNLEKKTFNKLVIWGLIFYTAV